MAFSVTASHIPIRLIGTWPTCEAIVRSYNQLPSERQSAKKEVHGCIETGKPSLLRRQGSVPEGGSGGANSFGVGRTGEPEGSLEFRGIEEIG